MGNVEVVEDLEADIETILALGASFQVQWGSLWYPRAGRAELIDSRSDGKNFRRLHQT